MSTIKEVFSSIPYSIVLTFISTGAASLTAYFSYKAIRTNMELQEQNLLPLFDIRTNSIFLDEKGHPSNMNPDPENIISLHFTNINHTSVASIMTTAVEDSDVDPLVCSKNIRAINYIPDGVILNIDKDKIEDKDYIITIKYQIQADKHYISELIVSVSHGVFFVIKEQSAKKVKNN